MIHVKAECAQPGWAYTVGLLESFGHPEMIVIGLNADTAHWLLNECCQRIEKGARLAPEQRAEGLLEGVHCEFRAVSPTWVKELMGFAYWFYGTWDFPVLQCIYPDLKNRFPWEAEFDKAVWRHRQPLIFAGAEAGQVEDHFHRWVAPDASGHMWRFPVPPSAHVFTTKRVAEGKEPILYVCHDASDGAWQFHGPTDSHDEGPVLLCFHHLTDRDPSLHELSDLPPDWAAWRDEVGKPWQRAESPEEQDES